MLKNESSNRRKQYFINKEFQLSFILKFCSILLVGIIVSTVLLILVSRGTLTSSFENSQLTIKNTATALLPSILLCNLITLGLITLVTIVLTLLVSHKLAGPMFRFQKCAAARWSARLAASAIIRAPANTALSTSTPVTCATGPASARPRWRAF